MATVTIEVPDEPSELVVQAGDRLPKFLTQSLKEAALPTQVYRYVLDFLASRRTPEQLTTLITWRSPAGAATATKGTSSFLRPRDSTTQPSV